MPLFFLDSRPTPQTKGVRNHEESITNGESATLTNEQHSNGSTIHSFNGDIEVNQPQHMDANGTDETVEQRANRYLSEVVLCHNDLLSGNLIHGDGWDRVQVSTECSIVVLTCFGGRGKEEKGYLLTLGFWSKRATKRRTPFAVFCLFSVTLKIINNVCWTVFQNSRGLLLWCRIPKSRYRT